MLLPIIHHPDYCLSLTKTGSNDLSKYGAIIDAIRADSVSSQADFIEPDHASIKALKAAHDANYVERVLSDQLTPAEERRIGLRGNRILERRIRISSGGTLLAGRIALDKGIALNTAGGSHHAHRDFGSGYCVFNDVAVAAANLLNEKAGGDYAVGKILVIDLDVHQGDGTATIFGDDDRVFTLSVHCEKNFPHRKSASDMDIGLEPGFGDDAYLDVVDQNIGRLLDRVRPDLIFYNAGVDVFEGDKLGHLSLTRGGIMRRDMAIFGAAKQAAIPIASVPGGGYGQDMAEVATRHLITFQAAAVFGAT